MSSLSRFRRLGSRDVARLLVERLGIPPWLVRYRHLRGESPRGAFNRLSAQFPSRASFTEVSAPTRMFWPLPCNVAARAELTREVSPGEHAAFFDVPESVLDATYVAHLPDCRIVLGPDQWGNERFAIVTPGNRHLLMPGVGFLPEHAAPFRARPSRVVERATWILYRHTRNHFHWIVNTLPRLLVAMDTPGIAPVVVLAEARMTPAMAFTLDALGVRDRLHWEGSSWHVNELTVIHADAYTPSLLDEVRRRLSPAPPSTRSRRVFVSREGAMWRRLVNEEEAWELFRDFGYERVRLEDLDFPAQVQLMTESIAVAGVHGAGLANTLFCRPGSQVLEIGDPGRASPILYCLACASGHDYWLVHGVPRGTTVPKYRNLEVDLDTLRRTLTAIEERIGRSVARDR